MNRSFYKMAVLLGMVICSSGFSIEIDLASHTKYGLGILSEKHMDHLENNIHKVIEIAPNHIGEERIQQHLEENLLSAQRPPQQLRQKEYSTLKASTSHALNLMSENAVLPRSVDNSKLPSFPPIGDQGSLGSCVAWGSTYYQASHEIGLVNGNNNKKSFEHVLSPKWTYNLINEGTNAGSSVLAAYQLLNVNGAINIVDFPYDNNFTSWDMNTSHWISALCNRMDNCALIPGLGGSSPQNLTAIKQALNNGHVLTFGSFIDSWMYTLVQADPSSPNNPHAGEYAAFWMNGNKGGHFMTIVGYDDDIWIDINQNGIVDEGEKGAFLVANSWGTNWGNKGFIWVAYDAFLDSSQVKNAPNYPRVALGSFLNSCVITAAPKAPNYSPKLIAEFSITQSIRNEINIQAGISSTHETAPHAILPIPALSNKGGSFEFDGIQSDIPETITFAIDLTDLIPYGPVHETQRYYLSISDNAPGHPTIVNSYLLMDLIEKKTIESHELPKTYDNESGLIFIDYSPAF